MTRDIPVVSIVGRQNVGKTTLIGIIIPLLKRKGYRVGTIKYNIPHFEIDYKGKDTYKHFQAGADVVSISSSKKLAIIKRVDRNSPSIKDIIRRNYLDVDIVLVEGYKKYCYPYIEINNNHHQTKPTLKEYKHHIKVTSVTKARSPVPAFNKSDLNSIVKFIESQVK